MAEIEPKQLEIFFDEARKLAEQDGLLPGSNHVLLALLSNESAARDLLIDRGLTASQLREQMAQRGQGQHEPSNIFDQIKERCLKLGHSNNGKNGAHVGALRLLVALTQLKESAAHRTLISASVELGSLRQVALMLLTSGPAKRTSNKIVAEHKIATNSTSLSRNALASSNLLSKQPAIVLPNLLGSRGRKQQIARVDPRVTKDKSLTPTPFTLDPKKYPMLLSMGRNLSEAAARGLIEPLVGRKLLIERLLDILGKRRANNPCLIGEPGVGKTAIVEGLAYLQSASSTQVPLLKDKILVELNMGSLLSGTGLRGAFSERMAVLRREVEAANGQVIVFLDEIHTIVGAGAGGDGAVDAVGELSTAMARGSFPCIGATTTDQYKKHIEPLAALSRRLQPVLICEPSVEETLEILHGVAPSYEQHHEVSYLPEAIDAAVRLSSRYLADRFLPDKAISLLDLAGSRAKRRGKSHVTRAEVAEPVAESTSIPIERLLLKDTERLLHMEAFLGEHIVGHRYVIKKLCQTIRRNYAGFSSNRPIGSFLLLGPTGVGKTETVKVLADFLFQSREAVCRFDMSEFMEAHSVARFIGSPPGYIGHEQGGQLTEAVRRRPYQIVLLDEVEKAHRDVLQILLQVLDEGRLTDGRGRAVDFSNTVVVMTSNLGSQHYEKRKGSSIGFAQRSHPDVDISADEIAFARLAEEVLSTARSTFPLELWNRIEERVVYEPLGREQILNVARLLVEDSSRRLSAEKNISFSATESTLQYLIENGGFDPLLGARPMRTAIGRLIEALIAEQILLGQVQPTDRLEVDCQNGMLQVNRLPLAN